MLGRLEVPAVILKKVMDSRVSLTICPDLIGVGPKNQVEHMGACLMQN